MQGRRGFRMLQQGRRDLGQHRDGGHDARIGDGTGRHLDQTPRPPRLEAQRHPSVWQPPRMQRHPATRTRWRRHRRLDLGLDTLARQGQPDLFALPAQIRFSRPVLQRTPAAIAILGRDRRDAVRAGAHDLDLLGAPVSNHRPDSLARQCQGHEDRPVRRVGDAVALPADAVDAQDFHRRASSRPASSRQPSQFHPQDERR